MTEYISLFWWKPKPNFGDHLNPHVVEFVSGRKVKHAWAPTAEIIAIGSVITSMKKTDASKPVYIWGTGAMNPDVVRRTENSVICAVRGNLTAKALELEGIPLGDPGLLVSDFIPKAAPNKKIGVVLHHSQSPSIELKSLLEEHPDRFEYISPLRNDPLKVVKEISSCDFIVSSSLHGLVVADAYGVPNEWIDPDGIHVRPRFKFKDYASAIGRKLNSPIPMAKLVDYLKNGVSSDGDSYFANISTVKSDLINSFPSQLKARKN